MDLTVFYTVITVVGGIALATMFVISLWSIYPYGRNKEECKKS